MTASFGLTELPTMTDYFALLDFPRSPWLDAEAVRERFMNLSIGLHPDKLPPEATPEERQTAERQFAELNTAQQTLRDPKGRLGHLLSLESGAPPATLQQVAPADADLFFKVSALCRQLDTFIVERAKATSPLIKASLFAKGLAWTDQVQALQSMLGERRGALDNELRALARHWSGSTDSTNPPTTISQTRSSLLPQLESVYRQFSYLNRWSQQLQERFVRLSELSA